jgi:hypothetical protein
LVRTRIFESERNSPEGLSQIHGDEMLARALITMIPRGVDPAEIAESVHDAVISDRLFIIPTRDVTDTIRAGLDQVRAALPDG